MENLDKFVVKELSIDLQQDTQGGFFLVFCAALGAGYIIGQAVGYAVNAYNK